MVINGNGKLSQWTSNGLVATIAWVIVFITYCVFRAFGIEDPLLGQVFLLLTGLWVGNLTIAQGKKNAKIEEKAERAEKRVDELEREVHVEQNGNQEGHTEGVDDK
jgi:hypothetical protein